MPHPTIIAFATNIETFDLPPHQRECVKVNWERVGIFLWGRNVSKWLVSICIYENTKPFKTQIASHVFTFVSADVQEIQKAVNEWVEEVESTVSKMD